MKKCDIAYYGCSLKKYRDHVVSILFAVDFIVLLMVYFFKFRLIVKIKARLWDFSLMIRSTVEMTKTISYK